MKELAYQTFKFGGPGGVLLQLMLLAVVSWLASFIAGAVNNGRIASMINVSATFISLTLVANLAWKAIQAVATIAGF